MPSNNDSVSQRQDMEGLESDNFKWKEERGSKGQILEEAHIRTECGEVRGRNQERRERRRKA